MLEKGHQVFEFNLLPIGKIFLRGPGNEFIQQRRVGSLRVLRLPTLVAQVLEKVFNECLHIEI